MTTFVLALPKETPMTKRIVELLIDSASSDYEDYSMIRHEVAAWARQEGVPYSDADLKEAIKDSVENELLQSYVYSKDEESFKPCLFRMEDIERVYFLTTPKGRKILGG